MKRRAGVEDGRVALRVVELLVQQAPGVAARGGARRPEALLAVVRGQRGVRVRDGGARRARELLLERVPLGKRSGDV